MLGIQKKIKTKNMERFVYEYNFVMLTVSQIIVLISLVTLILR